MSSPEFSHSQRLKEILIAQINSSASGKITFADYMALALYHPEHGYYTSKVKIGFQGDFFTSASLGRDFGELLAIQFLEMWLNLGSPSPFYLVEMGGGNGELAQDILSYLETNADRAFINALKYIIIERSPTLIQQQQQLLQPLTDLDIAWRDWSDLPETSIVGCCFSNELVDAFPVHLVQKSAGCLQEVHLTLEQGQLTETLDHLSSPAIAEYFSQVEVDLLSSEYPENYRTEVNLQALDWLETVSQKLKRGYLLTIDYGYSAAKYYRPARSQGTLQCYYQHRRHNNPYANLGRQDLTAHVDFTALERQGELLELQKIGFTQQGLFLMSLGLGDRLNELSSGKFGITEIFKRRDALHQLLDPTRLGGYGVLIQGKSLTEPESSLQGLSVPED
ncbi:MAG: class I SAM-dependent methyltransferase [Cyanobacteria bacterium J06600_6]